MYNRSFSRLAILFSVLLCILLIMTVPVHAQASSTNVSSPDVTLEKQELSEKETIQTKLDAVNSRISEWDKIDKSVFASRNGISETQVADHTARLNALVSYYRRIINALEKKETLTKERERIAATVEQPVESFVPDKPPYSLSYYQTYLRTLETIDEKIDTLKRSVAQTASATAAGTAAYEKARSRVRVLNEQVEKVESGSVPELDWEYRVAQTEEELYSAVVFFQKIKDANLRSEIDSAQLLRERDAKGVQWIREHLHYDETDLQTRVAELDKDIESIRKLINDLEAGKIAAEQELIKAQGAVEMAQTPEKVNLANLALKEQQVWWEYYQSRIEHSEEIIQYLVEAQNIWQTRYSLLNGEMETEALFDIRNRVTKRIETLESDLLEEQGRISSINTRLSAAEQALERNDAGKEVLKYLEGTARALEYYLEEDHLSYSSNLSMILSMNNRLLEEVETKLASVQIAEKVTTFGRERIFGILNTELWSGEGYSLTVRKLILAILILVIGLSITKRLTFALKNRLEKRNVEPSATMAIQKISYYILIITFILITLKMVNIPLTAFAFLGGALAIAIGFGAQNIFSNLITGFIIMFEKPFRVNDIVQVDGTVATVIEIGSRATTVRDFDNVDMMIPNSHFLNNNIINWTHSDKLIRGTVTVGVAYGSPAREVESLLLKVASDHSKVLKNPAPYVVFRDFGDSALVFELYFYVDMKNASRFFVASDLRYMVDNVFAKNNIVIAFPQMDVHVDMEGFPGSGTQESSEDKTSADLKGEPES